MGRLAEMSWGTILEDIKKVAYEFRYITGIGWRYEQEGQLKDFISRKCQRMGFTNNQIMYCCYAYELLGVENPLGAFAREMRAVDKEFENGKLEEMGDDFYINEKIICS